jgi:hypothetical protein
MTISDTDRFRVNQTNVVHETFEAEVLVVNLDSGTYYSLLDTGARAWHCIVGEVSVKEMTDYLAAGYEADTEVIRNGVCDFLTELVQENIVEKIGDPGNMTDQGSVLPQHNGPRQPFTQPKFQRFTDMQELLLLDPVHDVNEAGWPVAKSPADPPAK